MKERLPLVPNRQETRHMVSYFEHERRDEIDFQHNLAEIQEFGFNAVLFCVSEDTLKSPDKLPFVTQAIRQAKDENLFVMADPWSMGKVFGGEGGSDFTRSGKLACFCNPEFDELLMRWVDTVHEAGVDGIFWDEPEHRCPEHDDIALVERYSTYAKEFGLYNSVCIPADMRRVNRGDLDGLARIPGIDDIAADPYWPNVFTKIPQQERQSYVRGWAQIVRGTADKYGVECHLWLQGFGISKADTQMTAELAAVMRQAGVRDLGYWGYRGCESLFPEQDTFQSDTARSYEIWHAAKSVFLADSSESEAA